MLKFVLKVRAPLYLFTVSCFELQRARINVAQHVFIVVADVTQFEHVTTAHALKEAKKKKIKGKGGTKREHIN